LKLFNPITYLMNKLNNEQRFSFIGIILGIPIIVLTFLIIADLNRDIRWTDEHLEGIQYTKLLKDLLQNVQQHRGLIIGNVNNELYDFAEIKDMDADILQRLEEIKRYDMEVGNSLYADKLAELLKLRHEINTKIKNGQLEQIIELQNECLDLIIDLIFFITDEYNLLLTNDGQTYHMMHSVNHILPVLSVHLAQIRAIGIGMEAELTEDEKSEMISHISVVEHYLHELERNGEVILASESFRNDKINELNNLVIGDTEHFLNTTKQQFLSSSYNSNVLEKFFNHATETIDSTNELFHIKTVEIKDKTASQLKKLKRFRIGMLTLEILAIILTIYSFLGFYYSIRHTINDIRKECYVFVFRFIFPQLTKINNKYYETKQKLSDIEKNMSQQIIQAHEEEKKRVARELHDSIGQQLYSILIKLSVVSRIKSKNETNQNIQEIMQITENTMREINTISQSLRPEILDDLGFIPALKSFIESYKSTYNIEVDFDYVGDKVRLEPDIEINLYRICQEALTNVAKHTTANLVKLYIHVSDEEIVLKIKDDGLGFKVKHYLKSHKHKGMGLFSMQERAELLGGIFKINSKTGKGTKIEVRIPRNFHSNVTVPHMDGVLK